MGRVGDVRERCGNVGGRCEFGVWGLMVQRGEQGAKGSKRDMAAAMLVRHCV